MTNQKDKNDFEKLKKTAQKIRKDILKISYRANVGHIASALCIADIICVIYEQVLKVNPKNPLIYSRDRFILSKGHAAAALYAALYRKGFISLKKLNSFCQDGSSFGIHPEYNPKFGIEFSTGSLGHGLSVGAGLALGLRNIKKKNKIPPRVYVLISDAEMNEGSTWEAIMFSSHHKLDNLVVIVDDNNLQAFGRTKEVINIQPLYKKYKNFGWGVKVIDGHDIKSITAALRCLPISPGKPSVIIAKTIGGKGVSFMENTIEWHYWSLNKKQYEKALRSIK